MGRRVAREEESGESQTRQGRRGARPQDHRGARAARRLRQGSLRQAVQAGHQASGRPRFHAFIRSRGKLETRDRVRSIGEQICNHADVEGDGYNPFRNWSGQMIANISTPRPGVTEPRDVTRVFKLISAPWTRARFSDVVGLALRFDALIIPRPGMVNEMEWSEVDWDAERWTIPAAKMKTGWDHVVPLSRQALAIVRSVQKLTGHRRYAFSCSKDAPLSNNTLNKRLRLLGIDTKTDHCARGFRTTFSTLSHHEEIKDAD